jgi:hypothetical protein
LNVFKSASSPVPGDLRGRCHQQSSKPPQRFSRASSGDDR